jgi:hypothetical protein
VEKLKTFQPQVEEVKTEGRLRLKEGTKSGFAKPGSVNITSIESYLESAKTDTASDFGARMSTTQQSSSTTMPFPRVQVSGGSLKSEPVRSNFGTSKGTSQKVEARSPMLPRSIAEAAAASTAKKTKTPSVSKNPFEDEEDENNPFLDSAPAKPKNPFEEDDDYDSSLNPFAE